MNRVAIFLILISSFSTLIAQQNIGIASYYNTKFEGRKTATGAVFSNKNMTAASNHYKLGQWVKVTNTHNGKSVTVLINDRMAKSSSRLIDLTQEAAKSLCFLENGLCKVKVELLSEVEWSKEVNTNILHDSLVLKE